MEWRWVRLTPERAQRLAEVSTPGIAGPDTTVYLARQAGWILVVYQGVMRNHFGDRNAFIWRTKRDAEAVAAGLGPRSMGRTLEKIGAADDWRAAKIFAEAEAHRMAE